MAAEYGLYINGDWVRTPQTITIDNPAIGSPVASVGVADDVEVRRAIEAASQSLKEWSAMPAKDRAIYLRAIADRIREENKRLADILTAEQGKPLAEAKAEVLIAADYFEWNSEEAKRVYGEMIPASTSQKRLLALRQPVGVAAAITPWNFPSSMIARKVSPALAAGCTVVIKPSSLTPLSALEMARIFDEVGLPMGVANVVVGPAEQVAEEILSNPLVRKISFTGSTEVGKNLMAKASRDLKRISLELGGHAPFIVLDDADLDQAAAGVIASKFRNAGQTCICANRLYVQAGVYREFAEKLTERVKALQVGKGTDPGVDVGPMINAAALEKVDHQVRDALKRGGCVLVGGESVAVPDANGYFYAPTLVADLSHDALLAQEETFGPLLGMWSFSTDEEAIHLANATPYGLSAYFYGRDMIRIVRMYEDLQYGIIGINDPVPTVVQAPFGGMKHSGFGREGGHQGLDEYLEWKFVSVGM